MKTKTAEEIYREYNSNDEPWLHEDDVIGAMQDYATQFYNQSEVSEIITKVLADAAERAQILIDWGAKDGKQIGDYVGIDKSSNNQH